MAGITSRRKKQQGQKIHICGKAIDSPGNSARGRAWVRRFRQKNVFALKRNEAERDPFRTLPRKINFFSLLFASNFLFLTKAKLKERIFALFRFQKFFVPLLFRYVFASFHFRFALDAKTSEKTLFSHRSEKNLASVSLHFASKRK